MSGMPLHVQLKTASNIAILPLLRIVDEQCELMPEMYEVPERALSMVISLAAMRDPRIARVSLDSAASEELAKLAVKWMEIFEASSVTNSENVKIGTKLKLAIERATGFVIGSNRP